MEEVLKDENSKFSKDKLKEIKKKLESMQESEFIEIFNIIKQDTDKYTINKYGVHINMNKLPDTTIEKLEKFIHFSNLNKEKLRNGNLERNKILEIINNSNVQEDYKNFDSNEVINL